MKGRSKNSRRGFTLLEALVATAIMGIAVAGVLSALAGSSRNASRLTEYDRATLLARSKMDELLVDHTIPRKVLIEGSFETAVTGGIPVGWRARVMPYETAPGAGPGNWVVDRIELEIWWMNGTYKRSFTLDGFRRSLLQPGDL